MGEFTIEFVNFGVFVHHQNGVTVVLGRTDHELECSVDFGAFTPVPLESQIRLVASDGGGGRTEPSSGEFMQDLSRIMGRDVAIDREKVLGRDFANQNGRVHLHGGRVEDQPAKGGNSDDLSDVLWSFEDLGGPNAGRITNRATFFRSVETDVTYELQIPERDPIQLRSGTVVTFLNRDTLECEDLSGTQATVIFDKELPRLLLAVGVDTQGKTAKLENAEVVIGEIPITTPNGELCQPCECCSSQQSF